MKPVNIRRLGPDAVLDYRHIQLSALRLSPDAFSAVYATEMARPLAEFTDRLEQACVLGAYDAASTIIGTASFKREQGIKDRHKGWVKDMFVMPAYRGRGIGAGLLNSLMEHALAEQVEQLQLSIVRGSPALSLYRRHGFTIYGIERRALKSAGCYFDEVLMGLSLTSHAG